MLSFKLVPFFCFFFFKQKTAYEMRISDWSSDVCSSDLVEELMPLGEELDGVVVARIVSAEKHPEADRLQVCKVDAGNGTMLQIVCGAPNARAGLVAPLATIGTRI